MAGWSLPVLKDYEVIFFFREGRAPLMAVFTISVEFVGPLLQADKEVVLASVSNVGPYYSGTRGLTDYLLHASEDLRGDRDVIGAAMALDGANLQYATDALKGDRDLVMEAVRSSNSISLTCLPASSDLRRDREIVLAFVKITGSNLLYADASLLADEGIVRAAMETHAFQAGQLVSKDFFDQHPDLKEKYQKARDDNDDMWERYEKDLRDH